MQHGSGAGGDDGGDGGGGDGGGREGGCGGGDGGCGEKVEVGGSAGIGGEPSGAVSLPPPASGMTTSDRVELSSEQLPRATCVSFAWYALSEST